MIFDLNANSTSTLVPVTSMAAVGTSIALSQLLAAGLALKTTAVALGILGLYGLTASICCFSYCVYRLVFKNDNLEQFKEHLTDLTYKYTFKPIVDGINCISNSIRSIFDKEIFHKRFSLN